MPFGKLDPVFISVTLSGGYSVPTCSWFSNFLGYGLRNDRKKQLFALRMLAILFYSDNILCLDVLYISSKSLKPEGTLVFITVCRLFCPNLVFQTFYCYGFG